MSFQTEMTTDLDTFISVNEFAKAVTIRPAGCIAIVTTGIFTEAFQLLNEGTGQVETTAPDVLVKSSLLTNVGHGDLVTIDAVDYAIIGQEPDGTGFTRLVLSRNDA